MTLEHISVTESKRAILRDVTLSVPPGITVLLGRNGSGKTTLLRCAAGLRRFSGRVLLGGADAAALSPVRRAREISFLPQSLPAPNIPLETLTAFGRRPYAPYTGRLARADLDRAQKALERMGLARLRSAMLPTLSGGELQKAYFAMLLCQDTPVVLLDEPGAHLDAGASVFLAAQLQALRDAGKAVLWAVHDVSLAVQTADRAAVLQDGALVFSGGMEEFLSGGIPETHLGLHRYTAAGEDGETRLFFA